MAFTKESNGPYSSVLFYERSLCRVTPRMKLPQPRVICHMVLNIRIKMSSCFLCEMLKFIRKPESLISTEFLSPAICCMRKKMEIFFFLNHLLIVKCENADGLEKAGLGLGEGVHGSQSKPSWQGERRLSAEWRQSVGKHNYGNRLSQSLLSPPDHMFLPHRSSS